MRYLFDINNKHYTLELSKGETKQLEYMDGCFAKVTALKVIEEPTPTRTGSGFLRVEFDNGNVWDSKIATIAKTTVMDINELTRKAEEFYKTLNDWISTESVNKLTDIAYPNHDGKQDADVVATMFSLRDTLHGIEQGCKMGIGNLSIVIDTDN